MPEEIRHADGRIEHPSVRSEASDASFRTIVYVVAGALVTMGVIQYAVLGFFFNVRAQQDEAKRSEFPLAPLPSSIVPKEPRLEQIDRLRGEPTDAAELLAPEEKQLDSYGPTREDGYIHVPIARAMDFFANNLPARPALSPEQLRRSGGLLDAGASNSGRVFKEGQR